MRALYARIARAIPIPETCFFRTILRIISRTEYIQYLLVELSVPPEQFIDGYVIDELLLITDKKVLEIELRCDPRVFLLLSVPRYTCLTLTCLRFSFYDYHHA